MEEQKSILSHQMSALNISFLSATQLFQYTNYTRTGRYLGKRFCKQFSASYSCLPGQQGSSRTTVKPSENILQNLLPKQRPLLASDIWISKRAKRPIFSSPATLLPTRGTRRTPRWPRHPSGRHSPQHPRAGQHSEPGFRQQGKQCCQMLGQKKIE